MIKKTLFSSFLDFHLINDPNPFNAQTFIEFEIPVSQVMSLYVYDILGKTVAVLLNHDLIAAG